MGNYATVTSLQTLLVGMNLTTTSALAAKCISRAEARLNSFLAQRYDISSAYFQTTTSIPPQVREWADELSEGYLWKSNSRGGAGKESMARGKALIAEVEADLKLLSERKLHLIDTLGSLIPESTESHGRVLCNTSDYANTVNEDDELHWAVDPDKLDDIATQRE